MKSDTIPPLLSLEDVSKAYAFGRDTVTVLIDISFSLAAGQFTAIMGPSGSGKSTLLHIMGCLDRPTSGICRLDGDDLSGKTDNQLSAIRSRKIGFIFQQFHLIPHFTVLENVSMPFLYADISPAMARKKSLQAIEMVGLTHRIRHKPAALSGGEMQRVAIARAMAGAPRLILADEPTGNLDSATGNKIMDLISRLNEGGTAMVVVTHDEAVARRADTCRQMKDGRFV